MMRDLNSRSAVGVPTVRETDGLAFSSRNQYLGEDERRQAPVLRAALLEAAERVHGEKIQRRGDRKRAEADYGVARCPDDYVELVDAESLQPRAEWNRTPLLAMRVL